MEHFALAANPAKFHRAWPDWPQWPHSENKPFLHALSARLFVEVA